MTAPVSLALKHAFREAEDIARQAGDPPTTAHQLLGILSFTNPAGTMLAQWKVRELDLIRLMDEVGEEAPGLVGAVRDRCRKTGESFRSEELGCLHLLAVLVREPESIAYRLLERSGVSVHDLRTRVMSYLAAGRTPRHLGEAAVPTGMSGIDRRRKANTGDQRANRNNAGNFGRHPLSLPIR